MSALTEQEQAQVLAHIKIAEIAACRMYPRFHTRMSLEEMVSSAFYGLCKAAKGFRPGKRARFSTYAERACKRQIRDDLMAETYLISLPRHTFSSRHRSKIYKSPVWAKKAQEMHSDADRARAVEHWSATDLEAIVAPAPRHNSL